MAKLSPRFPSRRTVGATVSISAFAAALSSLSHPAAVRVDGHRMVSDVPPVTTAKGAYVPLRAVAESLGADANYDAKTGLIELVRGSDTLRLHAGDRAATLNGHPMALKNAPFAVRGRTMVSLNVIAKAFKTSVRYDVSHAKIDVMTSGALDANAPDVTP
ncbi:MAG: hypothetical protein NVSMB19_05220 [Vulcanimicrobiaceae bacterium]